MKKLLIVAAAGLLLAGCSEYSRGDRALGGAAIGAGGGALIGGLATRSAGGAIVGAETTPRACTRRYYDYYGNVRYRRVQCP